MQELASQLRAMQLYAHACHNVVSGPHFLDYHDFFGELYPAYEKDYDSVVERGIGLGMFSNVTQITAQAAQLFAKENYSLQEAQYMFHTLLKMERAVCTMVKDYYSKSTPGTQQLLGNIADMSEVRQYKLRQLTKPVMIITKD